MLIKVLDKLSRLRPNWMEKANGFITHVERNLPVITADEFFNVGKPLVITVRLLQSFLDLLIKQAKL